MNASIVLSETELKEMLNFLKTQPENATIILTAPIRETAFGNKIIHYTEAEVRRMETVFQKGNF